MQSGAADGRYAEAGDEGDLRLREHAQLQEAQAPIAVLFGQCFQVAGLEAVERVAGHVDHVGLGERVAVRAVVGELLLAIVSVELAERFGAAEHVEDFGGVGNRRAYEWLVLGETLQRDGVAAKTDLVGFCKVVGVAGPGVVAVGGHAGGHGIAVDVADGLEEIGIAIDRLGLVTGFEQVAFAIVFFVEVGGIGAVKLVGENRELVVVGLEDEMVMVAHEHVRIEQRVRIVGGVGQDVEEDLAVAVRFENELPAGASEEDVVDVGFALAPGGAVGHCVSYRLMGCSGGAATVAGLQLMW